MRKLILFALVASMGFFGQNVYAQDTPSQTKTEGQLKYKQKKEQEKKDYIKYLEEKRAAAIQYEKNQLKGRVSYINRRLEKGKMTPEYAEAKKKEEAEYIAKNIDYKTSIIDAQIALVERNGVQYLKTEISRGSGYEDTHVAKKLKRTRSDFVFAFGLNNALADGRSLGDSPYSLGGSRFLEFGWAWTTQVFENSGWLRFKYGLSFQFNNLKLKNNQFFVRNGDQLELQEFGVDLDKSKLRSNNIVFPVYFELGPIKTYENEGRTGYSSHDRFKIGLGGYAGFNLKTLQILKFDDAEGDNVKQTQRGGLNTNSFVYGLSGYLGYDNVSLYVKYDLNPIFKDNLVEERNISLGLRFDLD